MFAPLATALTLLAGFTLYSAIHSLFNAYYRPQRRMYLYFALMCILACGYIFTRLYALHSDNAEEFITAQRWGFMAASLLFLCQTGFIAEYAGWRPRWIVIPLAGALLTLLIINQSLPYSLGYSALPKLQQISLPWGEIITDTRFHTKTLWWSLGWLIFIGVFAFQFTAAFRLRNRGARQHGNALLWFGGIFFAAMLFNLLINFYVVYFTQLAEFGFIAMIALISLHLNREARDNRERADSVENIWSSLVMNAPNFILLIDAAGMIRFINRAFPGNSIETIVGTPLENYLATESKAIMRNSLHEAVARKQVISAKVQLATAHDVWLEVQLAPLEVADKVARIIAMATDITEQLSTEQARRDSEEKFRQLAENINQVFYIRDLPSNRMLYVSPAYEAIWGRSLKQIYDDPADFISSIHPDDKTRVLELIAQQNQHGKLFDAEYRIIDPQGSIHWIHARSYPIHNADDKLARIAGIVEDITQRKQAEQHLQDRTRELKQAHDFTEAVVDIVGAVIIVTDIQGKIVRFNRACEHVTGYTASEALGRYFWDFLLLPEERPGVKQAFSQLTAGQFPNHYENYWLHKNGSKRLLAWSNTCIADPEGKVEYVIGTAVDITEQRQAEAALRHSAEKYRTLMEYASDIILIADLDGRLIEGNSSALAELGYSREELRELHVSDIHPPEQHAHILTDFETLIETGSVVTNDTVLLRRDGQTLPVDIKANIIEYQGRKVAVGFMRDIRARKLIEQENLQAERRYRDMLVREVHHRIKNNLQGVIGLLRNSLSEDDATAQQPERLIARAISQIRTIAMVHGLQAHYRAGQVRICDVTRAIIDQSRSIAADAIHVEFHENVSEPALLQEEEAIPLALVINELLTNAIKHIPASVNNKQVIVELKGEPGQGIDLVVFNAGAHLPQDLDPTTHNLSGVGLDLVHALLPKQHTHFSLEEDPEAGGVYAKLRIEPGILGAEQKSTTDTPLGYKTN